MHEERADASSVDVCVCVSVCDDSMCVYLNICIGEAKQR